MKIEILELCAGYGSQALALKNLGIDVYSEIAEFDKYASQAYMQLHGETKNYGDIYTIDETKLPYFDMITYSTPCQDFSSAGKQAGGGLESKILCDGIGNNPNKIEFNGFHSISPALMASDSKNVKIYSDGYRIRKLTPRECFRLMGVKDEQFDRLHGLSNTQLYKLAGNSIVVNVLEAIFKNLLMPEQTDTTGQLTLI